MDVQLGIEFLAKYTEGIHGSLMYGDTTVGLGLQLHQQDVSWPNIKLSYHQLLPTGKYKNLNPRKKNTDSSGEGSYAGTLALGMSKMMHMTTHHYLNATCGVGVTWFSPVEVNGYNAYSDQKEMAGQIRIGTALQISGSAEYTVTQRFGIACDVQYNHTAELNFSGKITGNQIAVDQKIAPSTREVVVAPALEYNFNERMGIIVGMACSVWGKNDTEFKNGMLSFSYSY